MRTRRAAVGAVAVATLLAMILPGAAAADDDVVSRQPVVVVADFPGSMNTADADTQGMTRVDAAKQSVNQLLASSPADARLGLVVFGTQPDACSDIRTLNPVGPFDAELLSAQVDELRATGNTPIGPALLHAADELDGIEGPRSIILVSDGEPNCEPPPACEVAQELANRGIELTIHTIGFRISENRVAREVLRCIAETTGGEYMDAENADQLTEALDEQTTRAMISYEAEGERVDGGPTSQRATPLLAGQFVTSLRGGEEPRSIEDEWPNVAWFSAAAHDGWRLNVSATLIEPNREGLPAGDRRSLRLSLRGEERSCFLSANSSVSQAGYEMAPYLTATGRSSDAR